MASLAAALGPAVCAAPDEAVDEEELEELAEAPPPEGAVQAGSGSFEFTGTDLAEERPVPVRYHLPEDLGDDAPVALLLHGSSRNARAFRDSWLGPAERHGLAVIVPEFGGSEDAYPGSESYNLGRVQDDGGELRPREEWTYSVLEPLFEDFVVRAGLEADGYHLYGHSAGSQVAHRFLTLFPEARANRVILANAGWYTLPVEDVEWGYGLGYEDPDGETGTLIPSEDLAALFQREVTILLGEEDADPEAAALRDTSEARRQGAHRFERGHTYFEVARERAEELGVDFRWRLDTVPDVGHSNASMAPPAARLMTGDRWDPGQE